MSLARWVRTFPLRLRSLFRRNQVERDLNEEMQYHLERQIEQNMAKGMSREVARYASLRAFGNTTATKEHLRAIWGWNSLEAAAPLASTQ